MPKPPLRILLEMRPALEGYAGIPQATRLLFRGLIGLDELHVEGLLQNAGHILAAGLPPSGKEWFRPLTADRQLNRLGRVVITLEQRLWHTHAHAAAHTTTMALWHLLGGAQRLWRFDARLFRDFIWRRLFARTLPPADFDLITRASFRITRVPWNAMHICALLTRRIGYSLYPRLDTSDFDVMIAETPYPATVSKRTTLVVRYHDAIPLLMPHTISDRRYHQASHYRALRKNVDSGAWFVCVSDATRNDLLSIFPKVEFRSRTIHNMVSHHYFDENSLAARVPELIKTRFSTRIKPPLAPPTQLLRDAPPSQSLDYLLTVSTIEPRKNHLALLAAWEKLRFEHFPALKLLVVGSPGWRHGEIVRKFRPWMERGDAFLLENVPSSDLRLLYKHARATVCPSYAEGFGFSGVEAMMSGGAVIASDIAPHREVYADAAQYFNPYSVEDLLDAIQQVIMPANSRRRDELISRGAVVAQRYSHETILPQWQSFLTCDTLLTR
jgi:glycosyltransferase involved in cell wall biosynthesis